jgi:hypothetical protein
LHISAVIDDAGGVEPTLNIRVILSSARLAGAADRSYSFANMQMPTISCH